MSGIHMALLGSGPTYLDRQIVTVGGVGTLPAGDRERGYKRGSYGSIDDGASDIYSGALINQLNHQQINSRVYLIIAGTLSNSGWTTLTIGTSEYSRSAATFATGGGVSTWYWSDGSSPFGATIGAVVNCTFA